MKYIKIFSGSNQRDIQKQIETWIEQEHPDIMSTSISMNRYCAVMLSVVYKPNKVYKIPTSG